MMITIKQRRDADAGWLYTLTDQDGNPLGTERRFLSISSAVDYVWAKWPYAHYEVDASSEVN